VKYSRNSDVEICGKLVIHGKYECACMRRLGHVGDCIALARDAAAADGVRCCCWTAPDGEHDADCLPDASG